MEQDMNEDCWGLTRIHRWPLYFSTERNTCVLSYSYTVVKPSYVSKSGQAKVRSPVISIVLATTPMTLDNTANDAFVYSEYFWECSFDDATWLVLIPRAVRVHRIFQQHFCNCVTVSQFREGVQRWIIGGVVRCNRGGDTYANDAWFRVR